METNIYYNNNNNNTIQFLMVFVLFSLINLVSHAQIIPTIEPTGGFEIDGGLESNKPTSGIGDWTNFAGTGEFVINSNGTAVNPLKSKLIIDEYDNSSDLIFQGSKFNDDPTTWFWTSGKASAKNDINNVAYHIATDNQNNTWLIVSGDRLSTTGSSYLDFEFLQNELTRNPLGGFNSLGPDGGRTLNDMVISMEYSNGGSNANVHFYLWKNTGSGFKYVEQTLPANVAFAKTNIVEEAVSYGAFGQYIYTPFQFVEAAVNLTEIFGQIDPCFGINVNSLMVKTKASDSETASLGDFVGPEQVQFNFGTAKIVYDNLLCNTGTASVNVSGVTGGTFSSYPAGLVIDANTGEIDLASSIPGNYTVTYSFSTYSCQKTTSTDITISELPEAPTSVLADRSLICSEDAGQILLTADGGSGTDINWYADNCSGNIIGVGYHIDIPSPVQTTTYYAQWENSCGVSSCLPVTIEVSNMLSAVATPLEQVSCNKLSDGELIVNVTGGSGALSYSLNGGSPQASNTFTGLAAGNYTVVVTDQYGCTALSNTVAITDPVAISVTIDVSSQVSCFDSQDGMVSVTASGGTGSLTYSLNGGVAQNSSTFTGLPAGNYSVIVKDENGCYIETLTKEIINPSIIEASIVASSQVSCFDSQDGVVSVTANGGTGSLSYSLNSGAAQSSNMFSGLSSGNYDVIVTDENGCFVQTSTEMIANPSLVVASIDASAQVSCFDSQDAVVTVTASGGTGSLSYSLNSGLSQSSNMFAGLASGDYSVVVTDENGCFVQTSTETIKNPEKLNAQINASNQVSCFDYNDGQVIVDATGGTGNLTYSINGSTPQVSNLFSGLNSGDYSVIVYDENGCLVETTTQTIANPSPIVASLSASSQVSCYDFEDGTATVTANGGTGVLTYSLNGSFPQSSNEFTGLSSGDYFVEVIDENGCLASTSIKTIENPTQLVAGIEASPQVSCFNENDATVLVTAYGGTGSYTYSLNGASAQSSNLFSDLSSGSYSVIVYDEKGCNIESETEVIANPSAVFASIEASSQLSCFDSHDGVVTVTANGGTGSLSYALNNGSSQSSNVFSGLPSGNYNVVVTDENGCFVQTSVGMIANPDPVIASIEASAQVSCFDSQDGVVTVTANGGTGNLTYSMNSGSAQSSNMFVGLTSGNYSVVVTDENGCFVQTTTEMIANPTPVVASIDASAQVSCFDSQDAVVTVTASGGTGSLSYSLNSGSAQSSNMFAGLTSGNYSVVVSDENGCFVQTDVKTIANPSPVFASIEASSQVSCFDSQDGVVTVTANGGTGSLSYSLNSGSAQNSNMFTGLSSGDYSVVVTDENGCFVQTSTEMIGNPTPVVASIDASAQVSCFDSQDAVVTVTASGGTGSLSYSLNSGSVQSSNVFVGLASGNYSVVVTDENGCFVQTSTGIISNPDPVIATIKASTQVSCFDSQDGVVTVIANGGTGTLSYSLNSGLAQSSNMFSGLASGNYSVVVTDENGCFVQTSTEMIANPSPVVASIDASAQVSCFDFHDGVVTVTANGGTGNLSYALNSGSTQSSNLFSGLASGNYSVVVTDENGCFVQTSAEMIANPSPVVASIDASAQVSCFDYQDGIVTVTANGGTGSLSYSLNSGSAQSSNMFAGLASGNYSVVVTDENGCFVQTSTEMIANPSPVVASIDASAQVKCYNAHDGMVIVNANGGTGSLSYSLNGGSVQSSNVFSNLSPGYYAVVVYDENGCLVETNSEMIVNPSPIQANVDASSQVKCHDSQDGLIWVNATGGTGVLTYTLENGTAQNSNYFSGLSAGQYNIIVTDENGCFIETTSPIIANPDPIYAFTTASDQVSCHNDDDGLITVSASGGTGSFTYTLNNGLTQNSNVFNELTAGSYIITITDENGCTRTTHMEEILNPDQILVSIMASEQVTCHDYNDAELIVSANGGTGTLTYSINSGIAQSSNIFNGLQAGSYNVVVTDENGCNVNANSSIIVNPAPIIASLDASPQVSCFNSQDGMITVNANGGTGSLTYTLLNGGDVQTSSMFTGLSAGSYNVVVTDENGCQVISNTGVIDNPEKLNASLTTNDITCYGYNNGSLSLVANGGTGIHYFSLNGNTPQINGNFASLQSGYYSVLVTDENGCSTSLTGEIESPEPLSVDFNKFCEDGNVGINLIAFGGTAPYSYSIDGVNYQTSNIFDALDMTGTLYLTITDANKCNSDVTKLPLIDLNPIEAEAVVLNENLCFGRNDASVEINTTGGLAPFTYILNETETNTSNIFSNLPVGQHSVIIRDAANCPGSVDFEIRGQEELVVELKSSTGADCIGHTLGTADLEVRGGVAPYNFMWDNGESSSIAYELQYGEHIVVVSDANDCELQKSVMINNSELMLEPEANNAFSPNGDGINDLWVIKNLEMFPDNELVVINRWGNEVLTQKGYINDWNGSDLGEGTYFYILKVNLCEEEKVYDGYVTILR